MSTSDYDATGVTRTPVREALTADFVANPPVTYSQPRAITRVGGTTRVDLTGIAHAGTVSLSPAQRTSAAATGRTLNQ